MLKLRHPGLDPDRLPFAQRSGAERTLRRALRAYTGGGRWRRPRPVRPLPPGLRQRLLAIPATAPRPGATPGGGSERVPGWLLTSPLTPLLASFLLALGLSLTWGNPYRAGATTLDWVRRETAPASSKIRSEASAIATLAVDLGGSARAALPIEELRTSLPVTALLGAPSGGRPHSDRSRQTTR